MCLSMLQTHCDLQKYNLCLSELASHLRRQNSKRTPVNFCAGAFHLTFRK